MFSLSPSQKLTMLSLFLRIFLNKWQRRIAYTVAAVLLATALANVTQSVSLEYLWHMRRESPLESGGAGAGNAGGEKR